MTLTASTFDALDADTIAQLLGVSKRQLSNYININGLPSQGEGRRRTFTWSEVLAWYVDYKVTISPHLGNDGTAPAHSASGRPIEDLKLSERRKAAAAAGIAELNLQKAHGLVLPITLVARTFQDVAKGLQTEILALPHRVTGPALACRDAPEMSALLTAECNLLCTRLSQLRIGIPSDHPDPPEDEGEDAEASPEPDDAEGAA